MFKIGIVIVAMVIATVAQAAPGGGLISSFLRKPGVELRSAKTMGDIERCLIDLPSRDAPNVYRQPDRPDSVMIIWKYPATGARVDLHQTDKDVRVVSWQETDSIRPCL